MPIYRAVRVPVLVAALVAAKTTAAADPGPTEPRAKHRLVYDDLTSFRYNPLGLETRFNLAYQRRLYADPAPLYRDAYLGIGLAPSINPAGARVGAVAEFRPLTILSLSAGYYFVPYFGSFGHLQSSPFSNAVHSDSAIKAGREHGANYAAVGGELQLRGQLLGKFGPIALRSDTSFYRASMNLRDGDRYFYNAYHDLLVRNDGWFVVSDFDVVAITNIGLMIGARGNLSHAFERDADRSPALPDDRNTPTLRAGPLLGYVFWDDPSRTFNRPTVLCILNWWIQHDYRTGQDVSQAVPYTVVAFRVEGELWKSQ